MAGDAGSRPAAHPRLARLLQLAGNKRCKGM